MHFGWDIWLALVVASAIIWGGVFCTFLPIVPGTLVTWLGVLIHRLWLGPEKSVSWIFIGVGVLVVIAAQAMDYAVQFWSAARFKTSWKGALGAIIGGVAGVPLGPLGILLFSIVFAMIFEWIEFRDKARAINAGVGTLVANLLSIMGKLALTVSYAVAFYIFLPTYPWSMW
jgi:uncharacterized protein